MALLILNVGTGWKRLVNFMPQQLDRWGGTLVPTGLKSG
jgi:hypothetical protein